MNGISERLNFHQHARATPVGPIIDGTMTIVGKFAGIPALEGQKTIAYCPTRYPVIRHRPEHVRKQANCANPHRSELRIPVYDHFTLCQIHLPNNLVGKIGNQTLALINGACRCVHDQNIIGAGFYQMIHTTEAFTFNREHIKPLQLTPVKLPFGEYGQLSSRNFDLSSTICASQLTIINTFKPDNDHLPLAATLLNLYRNTLTVQIKNPAGIVKYPFFGIGEGKNLKPPFNPKYRGNPTDHSFLRILRHTTPRWSVKLTQQP